MDPLSVAVIGLLGVLAGAVVTGGVQAATARSDRRRVARCSARILTMHFHEARAVLKAIRAARSWEAVRFDWDGFSALWEEHSVSLATALGTSEFLTVAGACRGLDSFAAVRAMDLRATVSRPTNPRPTIPHPTTAQFSPTDEILTAVDATVTDAALVVLAASWTLWERLRRETMEPPPP
jgi:hypothetical protein